MNDDVPATFDDGSTNLRQFQVLVLLTQKTDFKQYLQNEPEFTGTAPSVTVVKI